MNTQNGVENGARSAGVVARNGARVLVVTADDFGMSVGTNNGIVRAHDKGIVTSTSLMVCRQEATRAAALALRRPDLAVGLHLDLGEWVRKPGGGWEARYQRVKMDDVGAVAREVESQYDRFVELMGRDPSHLDSHQHVHMHEPVRSVALALATRLGVPLRGLTPGIRHEGGFHGQDRRGDPWPDGIRSEGLLRLLAAVPPGVTELGCHPGTEPEKDAYGAERVTELETLCDPAIAAALKERGIALRSFLNLNGSWTPWEQGTDA